ncbi:MAG: TetR/AcrR family transcriptional regulator [Chloroflexota bacterium]
MEKMPYHHGNLKQVLLEEALNLIETEGMKALSLRKVAKQAGVSSGAPYHHFKNKDELVAGLAELSLQKLDEVSQKAAEAQQVPQDKLKAIGVAYVLYAVNHPAEFRLVFGAEQSSMFLSRPPNEAPVYRILLSVVEELNHAGLVAEIQIAAITAWSLVHGLAFLLLDGPLSPLASNLDEVRKLAEQVTDGLIYVQASE